jgi:hypothetical protein
MCFLERLVNQEVFANKKKDIYQRIVTFEDDKILPYSS